MATACRLWEIKLSQEVYRIAWELSLFSCSIPSRAAPALTNRLGAAPATKRHKTTFSNLPPDSTARAVSYDSTNSQTRTIPLRQRGLPSTALFPTPQQTPQPADTGDIRDEKSTTTTKKITHDHTPSFFHLNNSSSISCPTKTDRTNTNLNRETRQPLTLSAVAQEQRCHQTSRLHHHPLFQQQQHQENNDRANRHKKSRPITGRFIDPFVVQVGRPANGPTTPIHLLPPRHRRFLLDFSLVHGLTSYTNNALFEQYSSVIRSPLCTHRP